MIGPKEKKFEKSKAKIPRKQEKRASYSGLPRYISYKAALMREKLVMKYVVGVISTLFCAYFIVSRLEIASLYKQLRTKEYILAPGVRDFTTATPQSVSDAYVNDAANDFLVSLGTVNASTIEEQYESLKRFMSPQLKIQFAADAQEWIQQTKAENLAQIFRVKKKDIVSNGEGYYSVTAFVQADFYASAQYLGHEDQVVEMTLKLVAPDRDRRWYLQIRNLSWSKLDDFRTRTILSPSKTKKEVQ